MNNNEGNNNESKRTPIVAVKFRNIGPQVTELTYEGSSGQLATAKVPREAIEKLQLPDNRWLCIVSEFKASGGTFRPSFVFRGVREPAQPSDAVAIEVTDMVEQGAATKNIREYLISVEEDKNPAVFTATVQDLEDAGSFSPTDVKKHQEAQKKIMAIEVSDIDTPISPVEHSILQDDEIPVWVDENPAWNGSLLAGGRVNKTAPWDFMPQFLPNHVIMDGKAIRVNKKTGGAASWAVLNPLLKDEKREAGALLGTVSDRYFALAHPVWVNPLLKYAKMSNIGASVTSWGEGAKCRVDLDVTDATQIRQGAANRLKEQGGKFLDTDSLSEAAQSLDGLYKFGFTINNSLDGRGSFNTYGSALRVYCQNLAVAGGIKTAINMRHTKGVMGNIDWDQFGLDLVNATAELNEWLVNTELLAWIPMDMQMMDRLMSVMHSNNLLTAPRITKDKETGLISQVNRGHMDLAVSQGWRNPSLDYVAIGGEKKHTAYHALQCFTGAITHKPTVHDDKRELKGSTLGLDAFDNRLKKVNGEFMGILHRGLTEAKNHLNGGEKLSLEQKDEVREFFLEHPGALGLSEVLPYTEVQGITAL